jgi:hypothetical protein
MPSYLSHHCLSPLQVFSCNEPLIEFISKFQSFIHHITNMSDARSTTQNSVVPGQPTDDDYATFLRETVDDPSFSSADEAFADPRDYDPFKHDQGNANAPLSAAARKDDHASLVAEGSRYGVPDYDEQTSTSANTQFQERRPPSPESENGQTVRAGPRTRLHPDGIRSTVPSARASAGGSTGIGEQSRSRGTSNGKRGEEFSKQK